MGSNSDRVMTYTLSFTCYGGSELRADWQMEKKERRANEEEEDVKSGCDRKIIKDT